MRWKSEIVMVKFYISVCLLVLAAAFQIAAGKLFIWIWSLLETEGLSWWDQQQMEQRILLYILCSLIALCIASIAFLPRLESKGAASIRDYRFWRRILLLINVVFIIRLLITYLFRYSILG